MNKAKFSKNRVFTSIAFISIYLFILSVSGISFTQAINETNSTNSTNITIINIDQDLDGFNSSVDCDDNNFSIHTLVQGYEDLDLDGFTKGGIKQICSDGTLPSMYLLNQNSEDCDDSSDAINPGATEILYNNMDDDCNIATSDRLELTIALQKNAYGIGETVEYVIVGTPNSSVSVTLESPSNYYNYQANYANQAYPIIDYLLTTSKVGNYKLKGVITKNGFSEQKNVSFVIQNSITSSIEGDKTILENETLNLIATANEGVAPYTYSWNLGDGNIKTGSTLTHKYAEGGSYDITLTVKDFENNIYTQIIDVKLKRIFELTFLVKDKITGKPIAAVDLSSEDGDTKTGTNGIAKLRFIEGTKEVFFYKTGYEYSTFSKKITKAETINITLRQTDTQAPKITLTNKKIESGNETVNIEYSVEDISLVTCSLYTNEDNSEWWNEAGTTKEISNNNKQNFELNTGKEGDTYYKIECVDSESNSQFSEIGTIQVNLQNKKITEENNLLIEYIEAELLSAKNLDLKLEKVYQALGIEDHLRIAKKYLDSYDGDMYGIKNTDCIGATCAKTKEDTDKKIETLNLRLEKIKNETIYSAKIVQTEENIKYPNEKEIETIITEYYNSINKTVSKKEIARITENNIALQANQDVTTNTYKITLTYLNGETVNKILVVKKLRINSTSVGQKLIEYIPRDITNTKEISIIGESKNIYSQLIEFDKKSSKIVYMLNDETTLSNMRNALTILLDPSIISTKGITGFAIIGLGGKDSIKSTLIIGVFLIIILVRLFYLFELNKKIHLFSGRKNKDKFHEMNMLVNDCLDYLDAKNIEKSILIYKEIRLMYENLNEEVKAKTYESIVNLVKIIDEKYVESMIDNKDKKGLDSALPSMSADLRNKYLPSIESIK